MKIERLPLEPELKKQLIDYVYNYMDISVEQNFLSVFW